MKLAVFGRNIAHSLSPKLHNFWIKKYGLKGTYDLLDGDLSQILHALQTYQGLNVTAPYKETVISYVDALTPIAQEVGAINTIYWSKGKVVGDNTDYLALKEILATFPQATKALVLGNGGAAKAALMALKHLGIEWTVCSRQQGWEQRHSYLPDINVIINATPLGLNGKGNSLTVLPSHSSLILDMVYQPLDTPLLRLARAVGHEDRDGVELLIRQAQHSFFRWWNFLPDYESARKHLL
jgi:shikimate dehydrogenase